MGSLAGRPSVEGYGSDRKAGRGEMDVAIGESVVDLRDSAGGGRRARFLMPSDPQGIPPIDKRNGPFPPRRS